jgi:hypothetical protein
MLAALIIGALTGVGPAHAGAWTQSPGGGYLKLSYGTASANDQFGFDGQTRPIVDGIDDYPFADRSVYLYGEYGVSGRLTAIALVPFKRLYVHDRLFRYRTTGLGDIGVGARWRAWSGGPWVVSLAAMAALPTNYHRGTEPPLGAGRVDVTAGLEAGRSFHPLPAWATAAAGFRYRSSIEISREGGGTSAAPPAAAVSDFADQLTWQLEGGWSVHPRLTLSVQARGVHAFATDDNAFSITSIPTSERYVKLGGGVAVNVLSRVAVTGEAFTTPAGRNTAQSIDIGLGVATWW